VATIVYALDLLLAVLRPLVFAVTVLVALGALLEWLVRTRRVNAFGPVARFTRRAVSPVFAPAERRVLRAGGLPSSAPWWTLVVVAIGGIVFLSLLGFLREQLLVAGMATRSGGSLVRLLVSWAFGILQVAILVRVFSSLFRISPYSPWVRWSYVLSEPILRPLRRMIPPMGMFDLSPLAAYFLIAIVRWATLGALAGI
jgi:YggT family protein